MLSTGCIRSHEQQVAMLGSAAGIGSPGATPS